MENNINNELEQMRQQMQLLRKKLDRQEIINDKMMCLSVKSKMSWIRRFVYLEFLLLPFAALVWYGIKVFFDLSWANYAIMLMMCVIDAMWDYRINVASLDLEKIEDQDLTSTLKKLSTMKQIRAKSFFIMMPLLILWLMWTGMEMWQRIGAISDNDDILIVALAYGGFAGCVIGVFIGIFVSIHIYRKMQHTNDILIEQIKKLPDIE